MTHLNHKVIWITGASSGIGEALTYQLAMIKGVKLILSARRKEELERVKALCPQAVQVNIRILPIDLVQHETLHLSVEAAVQLFGYIDVLINNGGISQRSLAKETHLNVDRHLMEVDYFGTISLSKYLLPHFLKRKSGHFVTISSVMGKIGTPYRSGYAAAKHALHGFFDSLRAELWKESKHVYVTLICPGWVRTNITLNALTGDGRKLNKMDKTTAKGLSPKICAERIVAAIQKKKEEVYIGGAKEVFAVYLKRFFPLLFSKAVRRMAVR
ncbi:MAG: Oxidoreductase [Cytophagales bacterium]|jgi:short-subunit dehydrogenase|nr:SDR family oxidoreductase [Bacteroidota bacterium]MBS1981285.1 SDR family oxidoreductase [Bacteroidota bacterium]WHZ09304.1 MAG: Oxidoreductase [Cytophagales bacterium]